MSNNERSIEIIKELNDCRSKMMSLYDLYNTSLLGAETDRAEISSYYEQMIDFKNDVNSISAAVFAVKKAERAQAISKNKNRLKIINKDAKSVNGNFVELCAKYRIALKECSPLKTQYTKEIKDLCNEFKAMLDDVDVVYKKGFSQQVKMIKVIIGKIDELIMDYNVKRNQLENDNEKFNVLYSSVNDMISQLQVSA